MKLSKSVLTAVIAGTTVIALATSCDKERFDDLKNTNEENAGISPDDGAHQTSGGSNTTYEDCPACGLG